MSKVLTGISTAPTGTVTTTIGGSGGGETDPIFTEPVHVTNTTGSTDKDTGALVVDGGVGIEENLNIGGNFSSVGTATINSTAGSTDKDTGALVVDGGVGIEENLNIGGNFSSVGTAIINSTVGSTNKDTGALVVEGGVGIEENLYVGSILGIDDTNLILDVGRRTSANNGGNLIRSGCYSSYEEIITYANSTGTVTWTVDIIIDEQPTLTTTWMQNIANLEVSVCRNNGVDVNVHEYKFSLRTIPQFNTPNIIVLEETHYVSGLGIGFTFTNNGNNVLRFILDMPAGGTYNGASFRFFTTGAFTITAGTSTVDNVA